MHSYPEKRSDHYKMSRRDFLWVASLSSAGFIMGCAVNPVTGQKQFMLMSEEQEIAIDKKNAPHQISADYGSLLDKDLNTYISRTGKRMANLSQRPHMPYSFKGVNATYVNAYAFPGGSIAATRGILLSLNNEAELAGLLGHELGHVNARHTTSRMSKGVLTSAVLSGVTAMISAGHKKYASLASGLGGIGAGMLLASYSRDDERQADNLGMDYMVKAGYNPKGMVGLMEVLMRMSKHRPSAIEMMFATHPMSEERYRIAKASSGARFGHAKNFPLNREQYMDNTARLRKVKGAVEEMQKGEKLMMDKKFGDAETHFRKALKQAPEDYVGLLLMSKCLYVQKKSHEAERFAEKAKQVYPTEPQAYHVSGIAKIRVKNFRDAYNDFDRYERMLPGNPNTIFLKGFAQEGMQHRKRAATEYIRYLKIDNQSNQAKYAYQRLIEWGYIGPKVLK